MGERTKHKSLWDEEAETKSFPRTSENNNLTGKDQHPSQSSELYHEISVSRSHEAPKLRDHSGQTSLETIEKVPVAMMNDSFTKSRENALGVKEIGGGNSYHQNMSPDFKHNQSLENDRSHSRRYPGRGRSRSRSRSLSRGRERVRGRSRSRSRSEGDAKGPPESQSSGRSNRRSQPDKSTEICGDFTNRDGGADTSESWRSRARHGNKIKSAVTCKDFVIGKCRWGDTCRFSHHFASGETPVEGCKYLSSDQPYRSRKPLCKYFAAGKCDRDNCRFSHEDSKSNSPDGGHGKVIDDRPSRGNNNSNRWSHSLGNENLSWGLPQQTDNLVDKNNETVCCAGSGSYVGTTASVSEENTTAKQEMLMFHGSQLQNQDNNMNVEGQNNLQVEQNISPVSHIQQQNHGVVESASFHPNIIDESKGLKNATGSVLLPGQNMHQNGENILPRNSCISEEAGSEQMPALNGAEMHQFTGLNLQSLIQKHQNAIQMTGVPEMNDSQSFLNLGFHEHSAQHGRAPLSIDLLQVAPVKNPVMFPNQRFENEHSGKNAVLQVTNSTGITNSPSNASVDVPLDNTTDIQFNPVGVSHDPLNPMKNGTSKNEHGHQLEKSNNMPAAQLSLAGPNNSEVNHSGSSKLQRETASEIPEFDDVKRGTAEQSRGVQNRMHSESLDGHGKGDEIIANKDDKDVRLFKNALIEFVKDILKPTWKEGQMSREVHKTIVKKVVEKITSTIQTDHIPKTQERVEQYLAFSKPKIAKLVQAYVDRCLKPDS